MKLDKIAGLFLTILAFASCTETTDTIGSSLSELVDGVNVQTQSYDVESKSILADSVLSRNSIGYIGKVRDPETRAYVTGDFMAQFYCLENYKFPEDSVMTVYDENGNAQKGVIKADSCEIRLFYSDFYGDSTATMKLTAYEMDKPMNENREYYSNFDPMKEGYIRNGGISKDKVYALTDFMVPESTRDTSTYEPYITIKLNDPYMDKSGKTYSNYGTYILEKYYEDASNFKNAYTFRNNVVPGFYFKHKAGLGNMAYVDASQLTVYYKYTARVPYTSTTNGNTTTLYKDSVMNGVTVFWGTDEVLQTTNITNDKATLSTLVADNSCTYLKTPAGIFTELTLPVDDITSNHSGFNIASAKLSLQRINNSSQSQYAFDVPQYVLMVPKDSIYTFFEKGEMYNNRTSYLTSWAYGSSSNSNGNTYTFNNISGMINTMAAIPQSQRSDSWNKVVLVPVSVTTSSNSNASNSYNSYYYYYYGYSSSSSQSATVQKVTHNMGLESTKLVKGTSSNSPIKIDVIYSRFK